MCYLTVPLRMAVKTKNNENILLPVQMCIRRAALRQWSVDFYKNYREQVYSYTDHTCPHKNDP